MDADNPTGWHAPKRAALGLSLVLTSPGIPLLFQGQEFLEDEWFRDDAIHVLPASALVDIGPAIMVHTRG